MTTKTSLGNFGVLDEATLSAVFRTLDTDAKVRFTASCGPLHALFGECVQSIARQYTTAIDAFEDGSAIFGQYAGPLNVTNADRCLYIACKDGNAELAKIAIERLDEACNDVMNKARDNGEDVTKVFQGIKVSSYNRGFVAACEHGQREMAEIMLQLGATSMNGGLIGACESGHREIAEMTIRLGAFDFAEGLIAACANGQTAMAELMVQNGAVRFHDALDAACENGHAETAEFLIAHGANTYDSALISACRGGYVSIAERMIRFGATDYNRALCAACESGQLDAVKLLIDIGATQFRDAAEHSLRWGWPDLAQKMMALALQ